MDNQKEVLKTQFASLPRGWESIIGWKVEDIKPYYEHLEKVELTIEILSFWLDCWTRLFALVTEGYARLHVMAMQDTRNKIKEEQFHSFIENLYLPSQPFEQKLNRKLVGSGLMPEDFERPMQNLMASIEIFTDKNLPLFAEEERLSNEYACVIGNQTVELDGEQKTITQLKPLLQQSDRNRRERIWKMLSSRQLADRPRLNEIWKKLISLRIKLAENAGNDNYLAFRWKQLKRFDYSPADCQKFHQAILDVAVPAATRIYKSRQLKLDVGTLKPWDVDAKSKRETELKPFSQVSDLEEKAGNIFFNVDPDLGRQFNIMRVEKLLDLDNRVGKAPGGFCTYYSNIRKPFIFMNAVGLHDDVKTLLHEAGHSFHDFSLNRWHQQWEYGTEFAEVASMAMELLASPYLTIAHGGFYDEKSAALARIEHLESFLLFWPYMSVVDSFQQWVYLNTGLAEDPGRCDEKWSELWDMFMPGIDYSGFEDVKATGWHRKLHIFQYPLYYFEYGIAQLGAVLVWEKALKDQAKSVADYRKALALGAQPLPVLFKTAGAEFAFEMGLLQRAVQLIEDQILKLKSNIKSLE